MLRIVCLIAAVLATGCNSEIYIRDGVTDGDTFYLSDRAWTDDDPALQSWVAYSLTRSTCQLEIGGDNPARNTSYGCEYSARRILLDTWEDKRRVDASIHNEYLDALAGVDEAGFLDEYVVHFHHRRQWLVPAEVDLTAFKPWRRKHLRGHRSETRIIGSWNYSRQTDR
jgi:hypothetical protein